MKNLPIFFACFFSLTATYAQQSLKKVVVYDWKNTKENKIVVSYSIPDAKSNETYEIDVVFYDKQNSKIPAFSISDKTNISGIKMQYLYWDYYKDRQDIPPISKVDVIIIKIDKLHDKNEYSPVTNIYKNEPVKTEEKKNTTSVNTPAKKRNNYFSIGFQGNLGYPTVGNYPTPTFNSIKEFSQDLGFYMAYNHVGIEGTYFTFSDQQLIDNTSSSILYSENKAYLAYFDIILGKHGFHKSGFALVLSGGGGQYTKMGFNDLGYWDYIHENELGFSAKIGIIASLGKSFKFKFSYSYHTLLDPNQFAQAGIMIGF